ncbi:nicotinamide phosphoribosyl transferase family protein [Anopheles sinensis]|uniref:Nicotinamide phosphoribosyl transferase family protein n=1 Tax=Anopheles sinensis TaxID=74873 RepID=A0A084W6H6_ANOSI|nr:nicotinamide phosphoribosyl transferase family protein [Anopheles sinensis]
MQSKFYGLSLTVLALLLGAWTTPTHAEEVIEFIDIPNKVAWLPEGTDIVLRFLLLITDNMLKNYALVLERIKTLRETIRTYPMAYNSIALFYDNDIQHPSDKGFPGHHKPGPYKAGSGEAFKAAFETIQKFAGRRVQPFVKH